MKRPTQPRSAAPSGAAMTPEPRAAEVEIDGTEFVVDAGLLGALFGIAPADVPFLMRTHAIRSLCECGVGGDAGKFRLNFFYRARRAAVSVDTAGRILDRSVAARARARAFLPQHGGGGARERAGGGRASPATPPSAVPG